MMRYALFLTSIVLLSVWILPAQSVDQNPPEVIRIATFEKAWKIVNDEFYDRTFGGLNWNAVHDRYLLLALTAKTDEELYGVINKMLGELKVSHLQVISPADLANFSSRPVITGLTLKDIDGQVVIARVWKDSSAEQAGLKPGFVVTKIDDEPVSTFDQARKKLRGAANTTVSIAYLDANNAPHTATLQRRLLSSSEVERETLKGSFAIYGLFLSSRLANNIGYIHFTSFLTGVDKKIVAAIDSMHDAPGIIIDLRGNGGGDDAVALAIANTLFEKPTQLMITHTRKGDDLDYRAKGNKNAYKGKVVILIDEGSGSASEQMTAGLQESDRAYVIGKKSQGDDLDADLAQLPTGAYLIYALGQPVTPKGVVVEGRGVMPDLEVKLTRESLLAGRDSQLDAAIEYIRKH